MDSGLFESLEEGFELQSPPQVAAAAGSPKADAPAEQPAGPDAGAGTDKAKGPGGKARGKSGGKGGKQHGNKIMKQCRGCWKMFPAESFPVGFDFCWTDKRSLDNLYRAAKTQDQLVWWNENRYDDTKRTKLLEAYRQQHPEVVQDAAKGGEKGGKGGKRRGRNSGVFDILKFIEAQEAASEVLRDIVKEEFTLSDWLLFRAAKGKPASEAEREWWEEFRKEEAVKGTKDGQDTVEMEVSRRSIYRDRFSKIRRSEGADETKAPTQDNVDNASRKILSGMESTGRATQETSLLDVAKRMALAGGGSASSSVFEAASLAVGDVRNLVPEKPADKAAEGDGDGDQNAEPAAPGEEKDDAMSSAGGSAGGVEEWYNLDRLIASAVRKANNWSESFRKQVTERMAKAAEEIDKASKDQELGKAVKNERAILDMRTAVMKMVIETGREQELKASISQWDLGQAGSTAGAAPAAAAAAAGDNESQAGGSDAVTALLGKRPPCPTYKDLITLSEYDEQVETIYQCTSKQDVAAKQDVLKKHTKACTDLVNNLRQATADFSKGIKDFDKSKALREKAAAAASAVAAKDATPPAQRCQHTLVDFVADAGGKQIPSFLLSEGTPDSWNVAEPAIFRLVPDHPLLKPDNAAHQSLSEWWPLVVKHMNGLKKSIPRAQKEFEPSSPAESAAKSLLDLAVSLCDPIPVLPAKYGLKDEDVQKPVRYFINKGFSGCSNERNMMSCFRLSLQGNRSVAIISLGDLLDHEMKAGTPSAKLPELWQSFHTREKDAAVALAQSKPVFFGSVAAGEVLYLPPGAVISESAGADKESVGLRMPFLPKSEAIVHSLKFLAAMAEKASLGSSTTGDVSGMLAALEAPATPAGAAPLASSGSDAAAAAAQGGQGVSAPGAAAGPPSVQAAGVTSSTAPQAPVAPNAGNAVAAKANSVPPAAGNTAPKAEGTPAAKNQRR